MNKPIVIGIAGGSGSGKSSLTKSLCQRFSNKTIVVIEQDSYYKDQSDMPFEKRLETNYDHPYAFDNDLLIKHLNELIEYKTIKKPVYNYKTHTRSDRKVNVDPKDIIIVEGILILEDLRLANLMDIKLFVDTDADIRIIRRLLRDINERERTLNSVIDQYINSVRPMHLQFVESTKRNADIIIPEGGKNQVAIDLIATKIETIVAKNISYD